MTESRRERSPKFPTVPCCVCGDRRHTAQAHFPLRAQDGGQHTIPLCPSHHAYLDTGRLTASELRAIWATQFPTVPGRAVEEFLEWAYGEGYPYWRVYFRTPTSLVEDVE